MAHRFIYLAVLLLPCPALLNCNAVADMIVLSNGDKVSGVLIEVDASRVVIDSPLMGTVKLLRTDVRSIRFGAAEQIQADIERENAEAIKAATKKALAEKIAVKNAVAAKPIANGAAKPQLANQAVGGDLQLGRLGGQLGGQLGDPEVNAAFKQLEQIFPGAANSAMQNQVQGQLMQVLGGQLAVGDIRNQASDVSKQLRASKKELQQMGAWSPMYDKYLGILDNFIDRADAGEGLERK